MLTYMGARMSLEQIGRIWHSRKSKISHAQDNIRL